MQVSPPESFSTPPQENPLLLRRARSTMRSNFQTSRHLSTALPFILLFEISTTLTVWVSDLQSPSTYANLPGGRSITNGRRSFPTSSHIFAGINLSSVNRSQVWIDADMQYLARNMIPDTIKGFQPLSTRTSNREQEFCINWNKGAGQCKWDKCHRKHACSN